MELLSVLVFFQTISSDPSVPNCSQTEKHVCSDLTARLASDSQLISSCSSVCCMTNKCNGKDLDTATVSTESVAPSTTALTKGTLRVYLLQKKKRSECIKSLLTERLTIVNKAEWLGSPVNIKGANKGAKISVGRSMIVQNLLF